MGPSPRPDRPFEPVPSRRTHGPPSLARRAGDLRDRAIVLRTFVWSIAGLILGAALGVFGRIQLGFPLWLSVLCALGGWLFVFTVPLVIVHSAGRAATTVYAPSGRGTPPVRQHSRAETLVARGLYRDAVDELLRAAAEDGSDVGALLRAARILRDDLAEHQESATLFRRALRSEAIGEGTARATRRELIELYVHRMRAPERAAPELARLAEDSRDTPEGRWAAELLAEVKARMRGRGTDG